MEAACKACRRCLVLVMICAVRPRVSRGYISSPTKGGKSSGWGAAPISLAVSRRAECRSVARAVSLLRTTREPRRPYSVPSMSSLTWLRARMSVEL